MLYPLFSDPSLVPPSLTIDHWLSPFELKRWSRGPWLGVHKDLDDLKGALS